MCATRSAETNQPLSPPAEKVPTPDHPNVSPAVHEVVHPMDTTAVVEAAKATVVATPEVGTSASTPEPWTNHVSTFCLARVVLGLCMLQIMLTACVCSLSTAHWRILPKLMSRWSRRGMACVMTWSDSVVSLLSPLCSEALFAILVFVDL